MASYNELLALIDAYINQNGVQAITGQVLNGVLRAMVDQLGRGYSIMGAADPTTDPGTPDGPETWFASVPGTYTNFDGIQIVDGELALLSYVPSTGFSKNTIYEGFQTVQATIDGNVGTPAVGVSYANGILSFDFHNMKGVTGDPAGFGAVTASVDSNIGTPSVQVQTSGPDTAKNIVFAFRNLKGETGVTSVVATVDNTVGSPSCAVSLVGQELHLDFTGLKGAQGDTGVSADYPITIANNLTTNDPTAALSAAMGVQLESEITQLDLKVTDIFSAQTGGYLDLNLEVGYYNDDLSIQPNPTYNRAKIDVSSFKKIAVTAMVGGPIHQILTDESGNILWMGGDYAWYRDLDLTAYPGAKYFYLSNATAYIPTPSVYVYGLDGEVSDIEGVLLKKETVGATEAGYISTSGEILGLTGTWKHTKLYPVSQFNGVDGGLVGNGSVAEIAFFSGNEINSQNFVGYFDCSITLSVEKFRSITPVTAKYFAISTNYDNGNVLLLNIKADAIEKIEDIEGEIEQINGQVEQLAEDITDLEGRMDTVEGAINGQTTTTEESKTYTNDGYIRKSDGAIVTGNSWIHSDIIPIDTFLRTTSLHGHSVVAMVAFYSGNSFSNYISGLLGNEIFSPSSDGAVTAELLQGKIPVGATHIAFSGDSSRDTLTVIMEKTIVTPGLSEKVEDLETETSNLDNRVTLLENEADKAFHTKSLHFSFDDTISAFYDIAHNNRASIFDNAFFGALKNLHETYGAVFSCYCCLDYIITKYVSKISTIATPDTSAVYYLSAQDGEIAPGWYVYKNGSWTAFGNVTRSDYVIFSLSSFPSTYASEFSANAKWLKFGLHCKDGMSNYETATAEDATADYDSFVTSILAITGNIECVDTVVRLQNFAGSLNACRALRDADLGVQGFLCSDYSETNGGSGGTSGGYYLTSPIPVAVWKKGQVYDYAERLHFYVSGLRMDSITSANMPTYMAGFLTPSKWEQTAIVEMYCHENQMYNSANNTLTSDYVARFQSVCTWALANGFVFGYQMDKIRRAF